MYFWAADRTIGYFLNKGAHLSIFLLATLSKLFDLNLSFLKINLVSYSFNVDQWCSFDFQEAISCLLIRKMSCKKREKNIT